MNEPLTPKERGTLIQALVKYRTSRFDNDFRGDPYLIYELFSYGRIGYKDYPDSALRAEAKEYRIDWRSSETDSEGVLCD